MAERNGRGFEREGSNIPQLEELLWQAQLDPNRAIPDDVDQIDMQTLAGPVSFMGRFLYEDTKYQEGGRAVYLLPSGALTISGISLARTDQPRDEVIRFRNHLLSPLITVRFQDKNSPLSPRDLGTLFHTSEDTTLLGALILGERENTLLLRGQHTPQWDSSLVAHKALLWTLQAGTRMKEALKNPQIGENFRAWQIKKRMQAIRDYSQGVGVQFMQGLAEQHGVRWFSGPSDSNIVSLQKLKQV